MRRLDLPMLQGSLGSSGLRVEFLHLANFLLAYCSQQWGRVGAPPAQQQQQPAKQQAQQAQVCVCVCACECVESGAAAAAGEAAAQIDR
jgi:hypothetical protein